MARFISRNSIFLSVAVLTVGTLTAGAVSATNLVTNGDFEQTASTTSQVFFGTATPATGWTSTGSYVLLCVPGTCDNTNVLGGAALAGPNDGHNNGLTTSPTGGNFMAFDSDPAFHGTFSQTVNGLTVGAQYQLSFYMGGAQENNFNSATTTAITASFGSDSFTTPTISTPVQGFTPWSLYSTTFTADSTSELLSFLATGGPGGEPPYALLDGVSLTAVTGAVPEPSTWAMMMIGFGGLVFWARRRRNVAAFAAS